MGYVFKGIITNATEAELGIVKYPYAYRVVAEPIQLIISDVSLHYDVIMNSARMVSSKLLGKKFASMDYSTRSGDLELFDCQVWGNGQILNNLNFSSGFKTEWESFFRVMLELGIVLDEKCYFKPFDSRESGNVGFSIK